MEIHLSSYLFAGALVVVVTLAFWFVSHSSGKTHDKLTDFEARAQATNDHAELMIINKELIAFAKKECWHRAFSSRAYSINQYICGKYDALKR